MPTAADLQRPSDLYRPLVTLPFQAIFAAFLVWAGGQLVSELGYELLVQGQVAIGAAALPLPMILIEVETQRRRRRQLLRDIKATLSAVIEAWTAYEPIKPTLAALMNELSLWRSFAPREVVGHIDEALVATVAMQKYETYSLGHHLSCEPLRVLKRRLE